MAEGENKKPVVEMSIWFILLLVVIIIATAIILSLNGKLSALQNDYDKLTKDYNNKQSQYSMLVQTVQELAGKTSDYSANEMQNRLRAAVGDETSGETIPAEASTSGELVLGVSGETAE